MKRGAVVKAVESQPREDVGSNPLCGNDFSFPIHLDQCLYEKYVGNYI